MDKCPAQSKVTKALDASQTLHHREHQLDWDPKAAEYSMVRPDHRNVNRRGDGSRFSMVYPLGASNGNPGKHMMANNEGVRDRQ
jgi:hypothetical protein